MLEKIKALVRSRRFWAAVGAVVTVLLQDVLGLDEETATTVAGLLGVWIISDSVRVTAVVLVALLVPSLALADPPEPIIRGPRTAVPGDLVRLNGEDSRHADHLAWRVDLSGVRLPDDELERMVKQVKQSGFYEVKPVEGDRGGRRVVGIHGPLCYLGSHPGTYRVTLAASNSEGVRISEVHLIEVSSSPAPGPRPDPEPEPEPEPQPAPLPDGRFGIAADVRDWARAVPGFAPARAVALAAAYESTAAAVGAGTLSGPGPIQAALQESGGLALGEDRVVWRTSWGLRVGQRVTGLIADGRLPDRAAWVTLLREISAGLQAAGR
ncbi:MAG: hypothetical protein AAFZ07_20110 [Actinomycetota bacterium]